MVRPPPPSPKLLGVSFQGKILNKIIQLPILSKLILCVWLSFQNRSVHKTFYCRPDDSGSLGWVNNEEFEYTAWIYPDQPSGDGPCVEMVGRWYSEWKIREWNDRPCTGHLPFVCEYQENKVFVMYMAVLNGYLYELIF